MLRSAYDFQPVAIFEAFQKLLGLPQVSLPEPAVVHAALMAYRDGLDFADALHLAGAADAERLATFDRKLLTAARRMSGFIPVVEP